MGTEMKILYNPIKQKVKIMRSIYKFGIMMVTASIMFGCSSKTYTITESGKTQRLEVDSVFSIALEGNPTTGYLWSDATELNTCLTQLNRGEEFEMDPTSKQPIGGGGTYTFKYKVKSDGEANIRLIYSRPWETGQGPAKTFNMKILAGTMGTIEEE
jgi:inhibitor of cysteine peptidase